MISFNVLFDGKQTAVYGDKTIHRYYAINTPGEYTLQFRFVSKSSAFNQAIVLFFNDFKGEYYLCGQHTKIPKKKFPKENFWFETAPRVVDVRIRLTEGSVFIANGSDPLGTREISLSLHAGCAIVIEEIAKDTLRFHCNDHEYDDDFDDLVFDMKIEKK